MVNVSTDLRSFFWAILQSAKEERKAINILFLLFSLFKKNQLTPLKPYNLQEFVAWGAWCLLYAFTSITYYFLGDARTKCNGIGKTWSDWNRGITSDYVKNRINEDNFPAIRHVAGKRKLPQEWVTLESLVVVVTPAPIHPPTPPSPSSPCYPSRTNPTVGQWPLTDHNVLEITFAIKP